MMKATRFMKKPFIVTGYFVTTENMEAISTWCRGHVITEDVERPFIRVPVDRPTNRKQTEAYAGMWVIMSLLRGEESFRIYTTDWLEKNFFELPREIQPGDENTTSPMVSDAETPSDIHCSHNRIGSNVRTLPVQGGNKNPLTFRSAT